MRLMCHVAVAVGFTLSSAVLTWGQLPPVRTVQLSGNPGGDPTGLGPTAFFEALTSDAQVTADGRVTFSAFVSDGGSLSTSGIWLERTVGVLEPVALGNDNRALTTPAPFALIYYQPRLQSDGDLAFLFDYGIGLLGGNGGTIVTPAGGTPVAVHRVDQPTPLVTVDGFEVEMLPIGGVPGNMAFAGNRTVAAGVDFAGNVGGAITTTPAGVSRRLYRLGDEAPGLAPLTIDQGIDLQIDAQGRASVKLNLEGPGVTSANDDTLYRESTEQGGLTLVLREGDSAGPFGLPGRTIHELFDPAAHPEGNHLTLTVLLDFDMAVLSDRAGPLTRVLATGDTLPSGAVVTRSSGIGELVATPNGAITFVGGTPFTSPFGADSSANALFTDAGGGPMRPIAIRGQPVPGRQGQFFQGFGVFSSGRNASNDAGFTVFTAGFGEDLDDFDGFYHEGVFVARPDGSVFPLATTLPGDPVAIRPGDQRQPRSIHFNTVGDDPFSISLADAMGGDRWAVYELQFSDFQSALFAVELQSSGRDLATTLSQVGRVEPLATPGDVNFNGRVGVEDVGQIVRNFGA